MAAGNRSVLAVLDSRRVADRARATHTVFAALQHVGVAHEVLEAADYFSLPPGYLAPRAVYVIAHDGAGAGLRPEVAREIADAVRGGAGLVSFDREAGTWPEPLRALVPAMAGGGLVDRLRFGPEAHFVTCGHEPGEEMDLAGPVAAPGLSASPGFAPVMAAPDGTCLLACGTAGTGRVVVFGVGEELYAEHVFGHTRGIDGLMWRAFVWAAAKPFPMRCIPPVVTARMDDCNGAHSAFGYVDVLNRFGISPNLGLFLDELGPTDWRAVSRLYDTGGADFSMHAFRDDLYKARTSFRPYAVLADKPDLSDGGRDVRFEGLSMDHTTGRDLDSATVRRNFGRTDAAFAQAGIRHSRVLNSHFAEIGWRAVPLFLERGVDIPCNNSVVGQLYGNQPPWHPKPYGVRGTNGRHGIVLDRCPQHPGMTFVGVSVSHLGTTHMVTDILHGHTPFGGESDRVRVEAAVERAVANLRIEIDSLVFGEIMTHEERIDATSPADWEKIVTGIHQAIRTWDVGFGSREAMGEVCRRLFDSALVHASVTGADLTCELCGCTDGPSPLTVWENDGDGCRRRTVDVDAFDGFVDIVV